MATLQDARKLLPELSRDEKRQLLEWVAQDLGVAPSGIDTSPDVLGGDAHLVRTRIPVWLLEQARRLGSSEKALLEAYPSLRGEDLANAWAYVAAHRNEIEQQIQAHEDA